MTSERPPESAGGSQRSRSASGERLKLYCKSRGADGGPGGTEAGAVRGGGRKGGMGAGAVRGRDGGVEQ